MSRIINYAQNDKLTLAKEDKLLLVCWDLSGKDRKRHRPVFILGIKFSEQSLLTIKLESL